MRPVLFALTLCLSLSLAACGSSVCVGTACLCPSGESCAFDGCSSSTSGCQFSCEAQASCSGTCGEHCNVSCSGKACTHTVGAGSNVSCDSGECNITCTGTCNVVGSVNLTCQGGSKGAGGCE